MGAPSGSDDLCTSVVGLCDTMVGVLGGGQLGRMLEDCPAPVELRNTRSRSDAGRVLRFSVHDTLVRNACMVLIQAYSYPGRLEHTNVVILLVMP